MFSVIRKDAIAFTLVVISVILFSPELARVDRHSHTILVTSKSEPEFVEEGTVISS